MVYTSAGKVIGLPDVMAWLLVSSVTHNTTLAAVMKAMCKSGEAAEALAVLDGKSLVAQEEAGEVAFGGSKFRRPKRRQVSAAVCAERKTR